MEKNAKEIQIEVDDKEFQKLLTLLYNRDEF